MASNEELIKILLAMLNNNNRGLDSLLQSHCEVEVFIGIDALDELPLGSSRQHILKFLAMLASLNIPHVHVVVTSRPGSDIHAALGSWTAVLMSKEMVAEDMKIFVDREIDGDLELSCQDEIIKKRIIDRLVNEGNGM